MEVELVVDLGERLPVKRIAACFMQGFYADIWMPRAVEISVSDDDRHYTPLAAVENDIPFEYKQDCYREFGWSGQTAARKPCTTAIPAAGFSPTRLSWSNPAGRPFPGSPLPGLPFPGHALSRSGAV